MNIKDVIKEALGEEAMKEERSCDDVCDGCTVVDCSANNSCEQEPEISIFNIVTGRCEEPELDEITKLNVTLDNIKMLARSKKHPEMLDFTTQDAIDLFALMNSFNGKHNSRDNALDVINELQVIYGDTFTATLLTFFDYMWEAIELYEDYNPIKLMAHQVQIAKKRNGDK